MLRQSSAAWRTVGATRCPRTQTPPSPTTHTPHLRGGLGHNRPGRWPEPALHCHAGQSRAADRRSRCLDRRRELRQVAMGRGRRQQGPGREKGSFGYGDADDDDNTMRSQDRSEHFAGGRGGTGGRGGGGTAGKAARAGPEFVRTVPKFLQAHADMLKKPADDMAGTLIDAAREHDERVAARGVDEARELAETAEEREEREVLERAMAEAGEELGEEMAAELEKKKGTEAFKKGRYREAVQHFTKCISLRPRDEVLFSNRSAAYCALQEYDAALEDARKCVQLQPLWAKAHSRVGAALHGLEDFDAAVEAYSKGLDVEPDNKALEGAIEKALRAKERQAAGGAGPKFRAKRPRVAEGGAGAGEKKKAKARAAAGALSFEDEEV
ncbi:unnamed protein product [Pedinophyceae sp. YPF-701]|nr:unnamed protein product [Pedinophyceae sp. YPF-701]